MDFKGLLFNEINTKPKTVRQKRYWLNYLLKIGSLNLNSQNFMGFTNALKTKGLGTIL